MNDNELRLIISIIEKERDMVLQSSFEDNIKSFIEIFCSEITDKLCIETEELRKNQWISGAYDYG